MEIKHTMTGNEISYASEELEELIKKRKDLICRLQDINYNQEGVLFNLQQKTWKDPNDSIEVSSKVYDVAKEVMNEDLKSLLIGEVKIP